MSVFQHLVACSVDWPAWQRDALRRIVSRGALTAECLSSLLAICRAERGLDPTGGEPEPDALPLEDAHVPGEAPAGEPVRLLSLESVRGVNALDPNQRLEFAPSGLTVIYGDNGTGKSGYGRVLRRLVRARVATAEIVPNVFEEEAEIAASATISFSVGDDLRSVEWTDADAAPDELAGISLFDSQCAPVHVSQANALAYMPSGLDILPELAEACRLVRAEVDSEIAAEEAAASAVLADPPCAEDSEVGRCLSSFRADTHLDDIERLATVSDVEAARLAGLAEALAGDPEVLARDARRCAALCEQLSQLCADARSAVGDQALLEVSALLNTAQAAQQAAELAAGEMLEDQGLDGVGSEPWRMMWEAARRYSEQLACPEHSFPHVSDYARCVLCQQRLDANAREHLALFEEFVRGELQQRASAARTALDDARGQISAAMPRLGTLRPNLSDIAAFNSDLARRTREFLLYLALRRRLALRAQAGDALNQLPNLPQDPSAALLPLGQQLHARADELQAATDPVQRAALAEEAEELQARQWLGTVLDEVRREHARLQRLSALRAARRDTSTNRVTRASTELTERYATTALRQRFEDELGAIGAGHLRVELAPAGGQQGVLRFQFRLDGAHREHPVADVLSEGEHRCIALAGFLAEQATAETLSGIILDDPVSSLDHKWRRRIASRLADEARHRQVVVFTHDLVFLSELSEQAANREAECAQHYLVRVGDRTGVCRDGLPWAGMRTRARVRQLRAEAQEARATWTRGQLETYEYKVHRFYGRLRECWERAVEEVLLNEAVVRFRRGVETQRLRRARDISDDDIEVIERGMSKASQFLEGHDEAQAVNEGVPDPDELSADLDSLAGWVASVHERRN